LQSVLRRKLELKNGFRPRPVQFLELLQFGPWRIKLYGLTAEHTRLLPELVSAAKKTIGDKLPSGADANDTYGVGFAGIHAGVDSNLVFVDWWANENELHHLVFTSSLQKPPDLHPAPESLTACVFDLQVMWFERNVWVEKVLANAAGPDLDAYLEKRLSDDA
jgi:hypothetical protein